VWSSVTHDSLRVSLTVSLITSSSPSSDIPDTCGDIHDRAQSHKRLINRRTDIVKLGLKGIQELVQPAGDDFINLRVVQLRPQSAQTLLSSILKGPEGRAGDRMQRFFSMHEAVVHGPRELAVQHQEIRHTVWTQESEALAIHFESTRRLEHRRPLDIVHWRSHIVHIRKQKKIFDVQDARGLISPFEQATEAAKVPAFVVGHGDIGDADKAMARHFDLG